MNNFGKSVYLDANFLIYWFIRKEASSKEKSQFIMATLLASKKSLYVSGLVMDECWNGLRREIDISKPAWHKDIYSNLEQFTQKLLDCVKIVEFRNKKRGINKALANLKEFELKPRDAFHLAIAQENKVDTFITADDDFDQCMEKGAINLIKVS